MKSIIDLFIILHIEYDDKVSIYTTEASANTLIFDGPACEMGSQLDDEIVKSFSCFFCGDNKRIFTFYLDRN